MKKVISIIKYILLKWFWIIYSIETNEFLIKGVTFTIFDMMIIILNQNDINILLLIKW